MAGQISQQLGNYRLIEQLGHGGFADVYLGEHVYLKTKAAIKVLHTRLASEDVEQFRTEALTIAHLTHPHILRVLDFAVENFVPFLIMEYAPYGNLRQRHPAGTRVTPTTFLPYVRQIASALQYAHDRRLIHRDVKPENMLVGRDNELLLSDFGTVLVAQSSLSQSTEDTVIGTLSYMAPEQILGKPRPASDQYALAVVVYEWLSGTKPFKGSYMEIVTQHLSAAPPPLDQTALALPPAVQQVLERALVKDPHQRFPRVQDFAAALEQAFGGRLQPVVLQSPPPATYRPSPVAPRDTVAGQFHPAVEVQRPVAATPAIPPFSFPEKVRVRKLARGLRRGVGILLSIVLLGGLLLCGLGFAAFRHFTAQSPANGTDSAGATALANDFVQALSNREYDQAYNDLGPPVTRQTTRAQFKQEAQSEDRCYGDVTGNRSNGIPSQGKTLSYRYTLTRVKLHKPYQLQLTLQQNSSGNWQVTDYNSNVTSIQPACP
jgi:tRNA A-37 threonylcarbamoyl transferase component Bud32